MPLKAVTCLNPAPLLMFKPIRGYTPRTALPAAYIVIVDLSAEDGAGEFVLTEVGTGVGLGVRVGDGVAVGVGTGVDVPGNGVLVGVGAGVPVPGNGVLVGVGAGVLVAGTGVGVVSTGGRVAEGVVFSRPIFCSTNQ